MSDYFLEATGGTQSLRRVLVEQAIDKVLAFITHCYAVLLSIREEDGLRLDQFIHLVVVLVARIEGREADDHLISEDAESPPIDREAVTNLVDNFGCQILRRTAERLSLLVTLQDLR